MSGIDAKSRSVRELLNGAKYSIDYYQREYKWGTDNISELISDLEAKFLAHHDPKNKRKQVKDYPHYFLGSIVISDRKDGKFIVDGQQRLTSLTLLLIHMLHNLSDDDDKADLQPLIFSSSYGEKSFNIGDPNDDRDRLECMAAIYGSQTFDATGKSETAANIVLRYSDVQTQFPDTLKNGALPYFSDWLQHNVDLVQIVAPDDEAYTIFETMNDRGMPLSSTDLLKGYLLSKIDSPDQRSAANDLWKREIRGLDTLNEWEKVDASFFKAWLRAKYADSIREGKKGATNKDFEQIDSYHKWVRENDRRIGLRSGDDFRDFITQRFQRFAHHYVRVRQATEKLTAGLEYVYYNAHNDFTLQYPLVLAPLRLEDDQDTVDRKIRLVAGYLDIFIARRAVNYRTLAYSSVVYTMFNLMKAIRDLDVPQLVAVLHKELAKIPETFDGMRDFGLNQWSKRYIQHILARMTQHIERESGVVSSFDTYISRGGKRYDIEHIWASNQYPQHSGEFPSESEFQAYRNRIGGLLLLPSDFNESFGAKSYDGKAKAYFGQNLLARSLNPQCYENNPSFRAYIHRSGLLFKPYAAAFTKADLDERQVLYQRICEEIWSPARFDLELK